MNGSNVMKTEAFLERYNWRLVKLPGDNEPETHAALDLIVDNHFSRAEPGGFVKSWNGPISKFTSKHEPRKESI